MCLQGHQGHNLTNVWGQLVRISLSSVLCVYVGIKLCTDVVMEMKCNFLLLINYLTLDFVEVYFVLF